MGNLSTKSVGFAFLLLGLIFAVREDIIAFPGIILGIIGLVTVIRANLGNK